MAKFYAIKKTERNWLPFDPNDPGCEAGLWYRRLQTLERLEIVQEHTHQGEIDRVRLSLALAQRCIIGWEGFLDPETDQPIPYPAGPEQVALRAELIAALPDSVAIRVASACSEDSISRRAELKNSETSFASAGPSDDGRTVGLASPTSDNGSRLLVPSVAPAV